jgi:hypothetical protein
MDPVSTLNSTGHSSEMIEDADNPSLVDIGTCGLHTVHNAFKAAMQPNEFGIDSLLS